MKILMTTIGYPPHHVGGTEVYVFGLVEALKRRGHECAVAYVEPFCEEGGPETRLRVDEHMGTHVYAVQVNTARHKLEFVIFDAELRRVLIEVFQELASVLRPDLIHVHPLQLGFDSYLMEAFNLSGSPVVLTYHSTTTTCARGDLIYMGAEVCDSLVQQGRCAKCLYHWKGVPGPLAAPLARLPLGLYRKAFDGLEGYPSLRKLRSFASVPVIINERMKAWERATANARAVVAVCEWVRETIRKNGVPEANIVFSRHGLRFGAEREAVAPEGVTRFGYLGRVSPEKGVSVLLDALQRIPPVVPFEFEFCSSSFDSPNRRAEENNLVKAVEELQASDRRVRVLRGVSDAILRDVLAGWDALVVPSLWLESGPQVVYEAFAVRTPVVGSRLGGIAELVRDGETGFLFATGSADELAEVLGRFAHDPSSLRALRRNIPPVRTTDEVADDMLKVYARILNAEPREDEYATTLERRA